MPGADMGIDLGTSNTLIYLSGKGLVLDEPSVIAVDRDTDQVIAMGKEAQRMIGRTSDRVEVICPLSGGVVSDYDFTEQMMISYIKQVSNNAVFNPRIVMCAPGEITEIERRALLDAAHAAGARKICLLEEPVAAAIGAGLDITSPHGCAVVDIGGGTTDMAVLSLGGIAVSRSIKIAGKMFDEDIIRFVRRKYNIIIGSRMAEQAKLAIGCVLLPEEEKTFRVKGRDALIGLPRAAEITSADMAEALLPSAMDIIKNIQGLLEDTPPELIGDLYEEGIAVTGGGALTYGLAQLISEQTHLKAWVPEDPLTCVARGAGKALYYLDHLRDPLSRSLNPLTEEE